jgi:hypothetical protein
MTRRAALPLRRQRELADRRSHFDAKREARMRHLVADVLVNVVWSNTCGAAFHLSCRAFAVAPTIDLALDLASEAVTTCHHCRRPLNEDEPALAEIGR